MKNRTADDGFNARLEERAYTLYTLARYFCDTNWKRSIREYRVRERMLDLLDYIENGFPEDKAADISTKIHRLGC